MADHHPAESKGPDQFNHELGSRAGVLKPSPTGPQISQVRVRVFCLPRQKKGFSSLGPR